MSNLEEKSKYLETHEFLVNKLKEIDTIRSTQYKAGGIVEFDSKQYKLDDIRDLPTLIKIYGKLLTSKAVWEQAVEEIGLSTTPSPMIGGRNIEDCLDDVKLRAKVVDTETTKRNFEEKLKQVEQFFSKEDRFDKLRESISSELGVEFNTAAEGANLLTEAKNINDEKSDSDEKSDKS